MTVPEIRFTLPTGAIDQTYYRFSSGEEDIADREELAFDRDRLPGGVSDLEGLVKYRLRCVRDVTEGAVEVPEDVLVRFGASPARRLVVEQRADGKAVWTVCLLTVLSNGTYLQLTYHAPGDYKKAVERLEYIAGSVRPAGGETGVAREGFTRRGMGTVTLEAPSRLRPPSQYLFLLPGGVGKLHVDVWRPSDPDPAVPLSAWMAADAAVAGQMGASFAHSSWTGGGTADFLRYTFTETEMESGGDVAVWRARVQFASGTVVSAAVRSPGPLRPETDNLFAAFVNSLREE